MTNNKRLLNSPLYTAHREWFEIWGERAAPYYENAFFSFMAIAKDKSRGPHIIESNGFYEALTATINILDFLPMLKIFVGDYIPPPIYAVISELRDKLAPKLEEMEKRCIKQEGLTCIAPDDLVALIKMLVDFINQIATFISTKVTEWIDPFNDFIKDFDDTIKIDLVDGDYHILVAQESEERAAKLEKLHSKLSKAEVNQQSMRQAKNDSLVFVVYDKHDVVNYIEQRWQNKLLLTKHGQTSLEKSGYKDLKQIVAAFDLLANEYHSTYSKTTRMEDAVSATAALGIEFKPSMSDTTMGNHPVYQREYDGRPADFNRHLCLGKSRRAEHCMRIHFEWDEKINKIVVHHAGNHLPTSTS